MTTPNPDRPSTAGEELDRLVRLARTIAEAHRRLAEHNEQGPDGWKLASLVNGTRTIADDFDAIASRLTAAAERERVLREAVEDAIAYVSRGRVASIGAVENTYCPRVPVYRVQRWRAALTATTQGSQGR